MAPEIRMAPKAAPQAAQIVTVGRAVHFVMPGASGGTHPHRAAIVTAIGEFGIEDSVELTVFLSNVDSKETLFRRQRAVPFEKSGTIPMTWHWPERDTGLDKMDEARLADAGAVHGVRQFANTTKDPHAGRAEDANGRGQG